MKKHLLFYFILFYFVAWSGGLVREFGHGHDGSFSQCNWLATGCNHVAPRVKTI